MQVFFFSKRRCENPQLPGGPMQTRTERLNKKMEYGDIDRISYVQQNEMHKGNLHFYLLSLLLLYILAVTHKLSFTITF